jgi:hypothetical protein
MEKRNFDKDERTSQSHLCSRVRAPSNPPSPRKLITSSSSSGEVEEETSAAFQVMRRPTKDPLAPALEAKSHPRKMKKTEGEAEEPPLLKQAAALPPPTAMNAGATKAEEEDEEYDAEEHLKEKSERYSHLWQAVLRAEEQLSFSFKGTFLKLDDAMASVINTKVGNACLRKKRVQLKHKAICKELFEYLGIEATVNHSSTFPILLQVEKNLDLVALVGRLIMYC